MPAINWKATERFVTTLVPSSHRSLANVKLRLETNEHPTSAEVFHIEQSQDWNRFTPELFVDIDIATLLSDTKFEADDIAISVIVRDRGLGRFEKIQEWRLDNLPEDAWSLSQALERFSRSVHLDLSVVATPRASIIGPKSVPIPKGTVLAAKTFKIRLPSRMLDFPFKLVAPEEMERQQGLDRNTVYYVHWRGEDVHRTPSDLIEVWLNKEFEDKFRVLSGKHIGVAGNHIGCNIAAHVYAEVLAHVLSSEEDSEEPTSLVVIVRNMVQQELKMSLDDLRSIYSQGPDGRSRLMPWCWKLARADQAFANLTL